MRKNPMDLVLVEHDREPLRLGRPLHSLELVNFDLLIEQKQRAQGLVLGRGGDVLPARQVRQNAVTSGSAISRG
jgi:hypothetical protein